MISGPTLDRGHARAESLTHLLGRLELVADRVRAAVEWRRTSDPDPLDRFRGLHISPAHVEGLLSNSSAPMPPDDTFAARLARIESDADTAEKAGVDLRLRRLARAFDLDDLDIEAVLIAVAPDLDDRFERLYGYLNDDVSRRRASIGLWLELCGLKPAGAVAWQRLAPGGALTESRLILVEDSDRPFLTRSLRVPDRITAYLLGDDSPDAELSSMILGSAPAIAAAPPELVRWLGDHAPLAYIRERPGNAASPFALGAIAAAGRAALAIDLRRVRPEDDPIRLAALAAREARLVGAVLVAGPVEALAGRGVSAIQAWSELPRCAVLFGSGNWDPIWSREVPFLWETPVAIAAERAELWRAGINGEAVPGLDPVQSTAQFRLTAEQVQRATLAARLQARASGRPVEAADLRAGARAQNAAGLERLARRIEPAVGFTDLVLPEDVLDQLGDLTVRARQRERVLDEWKMAGAGSRRRGLTALFAGPSGTGKTMAAEVVAHEMGLDLYVVDLASVVDKYVGETEKNLDRVFAEAENVNAVLLFDEADALFGKRSEVSDAHDRYANVEIAYLLQRMELFEGIAILATNLRSNLDEAFARRLDTLIDFPEPEEADRLRLWDRCLGRLAPRANDVDLAFLARAFKLSGGNIRNIAVAAAYYAAEGERAITMADLVRGTQREYRKLGRMVVDSEFGRYYDVLAIHGR